MLDATKEIGSQMRIKAIPLMVWLSYGAGEERKAD